MYIYIVNVYSPYCTRLDYLGKNEMAHTVFVRTTHSLNVSADLKYDIKYMQLYNSISTSKYTIPYCVEIQTKIERNSEER